MTILHLLARDDFLGLKVIEEISEETNIYKLRLSL